MTARAFQWGHWYDFAEGGPVEQPVERPGSLPFELARWSLAPGTANDREAHRSAEVWIVRAGSGRAVVDGRSCRLGPGDVLHLPSGAEHQLTDDGDDVLHAVSVYWVAEAPAAQLSPGTTPPVPAGG